MEILGLDYRDTCWCWGQWCRDIWGGGGWGHRAGVGFWGHWDGDNGKTQVWGARDSGAGVGTLGQDYGDNGILWVLRTTGQGHWEGKGGL